MTLLPTPVCRGLPKKATFPRDVSEKSPPRRCLVWLTNPPMRTNDVAIYLVPFHYGDPARSGGFVLVLWRSLSNAYWLTCIPYLRCRDRYQRGNSLHATDMHHL